MNIRAKKEQLPASPYQLLVVLTGAIAITLCFTLTNRITTSAKCFSSVTDITNPRPDAKDRLLTFAARVIYQKAIEEVYWRHRIWPKENSRPKPSFAEVMAPAQIERKVEKYLRDSQTIEAYMHQPITPRQLQAELERMARSTKQPEVLREIWEALGNNPPIIAECFAREILVERLVTDLHLPDARLRRELVRSLQTQQVEAVRSEYALPTISAPRAMSNSCTDDTWTATSTNGADARSGHTAVWTGTEMIIWGGQDISNYLDTGARYTPSTDSWIATSTNSAPSARLSHTAVWTGARMIVWGGTGPDGQLNTGGSYDPSTDSWAGTSTRNAPPARAQQTAIWTGSQMIVWGGLFGPFHTVLDSGGRYDPTADIWTNTNITNTPMARVNHTAVWTGSEMIVWGGNDSFGNGFNDGGKYNPTADSWTAITLTNAPAYRSSHTSIWTGTEMIVWGGDGRCSGGNCVGYFNNGGRYSPGTNSWASLSTTNAPSARAAHLAVWTGNEMLIWGGRSFSGSFQSTGGRYNPGTDSWSAMNIINAPTQGFFTSVWTGSQLIVSGGVNTGGRYCAQPAMTVVGVIAPAGRTSGGQQIILTGVLNNLSTVTIGGSSTSWFYTNGAGDTSTITATTPAHAVGAVQIDLTPTAGGVYSKTNAFAYLPTVFTDDTIAVGQTTAKAQHIIEMRQAVDALRAVAGLSGAPWTDPSLQPGHAIKAIHIVELRTFLDDAATRLGYSISAFTDPGLTSGFPIKRIHIEELRQRIRAIAG
jgi:N-acetylneuraminic acid mutarotase